jgi:lysozyme
MTIWQDIQRRVGVAPDGVPGEETARAIAKALGVAPAPAERRTSAAGLDLIKRHEGLRLRAYLCPAGVWTIGYGHTGADVRQGLIITEAQADAMIERDVQRFEAAVRRLCPATTQGQFDALVSFAFNLGEAALDGSTLRRLHNAGDHEGAAANFGKWTKARVSGNLVELSGLVKRRAEEARLYRSAS